MKKILFVSTFLFASIIATKNAQSQVRVGVNINIGSQPAWGPVGYDYVDYYYMPDIDVYYYVPQRQFIYFSSGRWVFANSLPSRYRGYDMYSGYKVVINEPRPYLRNDYYRNQYGGYRGRLNQQVIIRNSDDPRYHNHRGKGHYKHKEHGRGRGKHH